MKFRHELKHEITLSDMLVLRSRLSAVMYPDSHAENGKYEIKSLYFDDLNDTALREKIDGVDHREKFRMRFYNDDTSFIRLEKKSKINGLCLKEQAVLTFEQANAVAKGDFSVIADSKDGLISEFYSKTEYAGLRPKTIVVYTREPFVFAPGNVRVTLDYNIRTGSDCSMFLSDKCVTVPAGDAPAILEVKWDEFLPSVICDAVRLTNAQTGAFSKYAACRIYG